MNGPSERLPSLRTLHAALAIMRCGGVSAAAADIHLSQPALTQSVQRLEGVLGVDLFDRKRGFDLSDPGRVFLPRAAVAVRHLLRLVGPFSTAARPHLYRYLTLPQLRALVATVETGSFQQAADRLGTEPSTVQRAVRDLEKLLRARLLEPTGRRFHPTGEAEEAARLASLAIAAIRQGLAEIRGWKGNYVGELKIGCLPLAQTRLVPDALLALAREFPKVEIAVLDGPYPMLERSLRRGDIDLIVGALRGASLPDDLVQTDLFEDQMIVVARAGHPLSHQATEADLARFPWVVPRRDAPGRLVFNAIARRFDTAAMADEAPIETGSLPILRGVLTQSDRLALISERQVAYEIRSGVLQRVPVILETTRMIGLTQRRDWVPSHPHERLIAVFETLV